MGLLLTDLPLLTSKSLFKSCLPRKHISFHKFRFLKFPSDQRYQLECGLDSCHVPDGHSLHQGLRNSVYWSHRSTQTVLDFVLLWPFKIFEFGRTLHLESYIFLLILKLISERLLYFTRLYLTHEYCYELNCVSPPKSFTHFIYLCKWKKRKYVEILTLSISKHDVIWRDGPCRDN